MRASPAEQFFSAYAKIHTIVSGHAQVTVARPRVRKCCVMSAGLTMIKRFMFDLFMLIIILGGIALLLEVLYTIPEWWY